MVGECPTCGDEFDSERGMKIHHKRTHGESIAGVEVECHYCGNTFRKKEFEASRYERQFCPGGDCHAKWRSEWGTGENNPFYDGGEVERECEYCGETVRRNPSEFPGENVFCSYDCHNQYKSENRQGQDHPCWEGGYDEFYGADWQEQRDKARERDNYTCQDCGVKESELDIQLSVHHITPKDDFTDVNGNVDYEAANKLDNLLTLCRPCHGKWEGLYLRPDTRD